MTDEKFRWRSTLLARRFEKVRTRRNKVFTELIDLILADTDQDLTVLLGQHILMQEEQRIIAGLIQELRKRENET